MLVGYDHFRSSAVLCDADASVETRLLQYCKALISVSKDDIHLIQKNLFKKIRVSKRRNFEMNFLLDRSVPPEPR